MRSNNEHSSELRENVEYHYKEKFCTELGCEYNGKRAVQGHCFDRVEDRARDTLAYYKQRHQGDEYIGVLESLYLCVMMNLDLVLDEVVLLRKENAELRTKLDAGK